MWQERLPDAAAGLIVATLGLLVAVLNYGGLSGYAPMPRDAIRTVHNGNAVLAARPDDAGGPPLPGARSGAGEVSP